MIQLIGLTDALATIREHCDAIGMQPSLMVCAISPNGGRFRGRVSGRTAAHFVPESPRLPMSICQPDLAKHLRAIKTTPLRAQPWGILLRHSTRGDSVRAQPRLDGTVKH